MISNTPASLSVAVAVRQVVVENEYSAFMATYKERVRLRHYNSRPSVLSAVSASDGARILRQVMPGLTRLEHAALAAVHEDMAEGCSTAWSALVDIASIETSGRPYSIFDYKISCIAREEFIEERKEQLRVVALAGTAHRTAARAHARLAAGRMKLH